MNRHDRRALARQTRTPFVPQVTFRTDSPQSNLSFEPVKPDPRRKGEPGQNCNREACQQPGAIYYNKSTQKYYCASCARKINDANSANVYVLYGVPDLCEIDQAALDAWEQEIEIQKSE